ncbi:MAG TPA: septum formation initiator family protein [Candidatus Paceibacterota bacterium]|jgi:cell division protein FtsB|nr:septum formation initiator family protein [Candidatus Paceibacterota bacterium]
MLQYNEKTKLRRRIYSIPVFVVLLVITILVVRGTWDVYWKRVESRQNLDKVTEQAAALESRQAELNDEIDRLQTQAGVEEEIRKKFSVVKDGEQVAVLVDNGASTTPAPPPKPGFWKKMWMAVTGMWGGNGNTAAATETPAEAIGTSTE